MRGPDSLKVLKLPFLIGDVLLVLTAAAVYLQSNKPMGPWEIGAVCACMALAAAVGIVPFVLEYRASMRFDEAEMLGSSMAQLKSLETLAARIDTATGKWQTVQDAADKTAAGAKSFSDRMSSELKSFTEFMEKANSAEKGNLKLEVEKLRRSEGEWLQVLVFILDHTHALLQGALHLGQPNVVQQVQRFQHVCRDAARRVGLAPFGAAADEPFNPERHQLADRSKPESGGQIEELLALGYSFQGRILRPAVVKLKATEAEADNADETESAAPESNA